MAEKTDGYKPSVGDRVIGPQKLEAIVRFVGETAFSTGEWVGIELFESKGKNDGSVQGKRYFTCQPSFGMFVRPSNIKLIKAKELSGSAKASRSATPKADNRSAAKKQNSKGSLNNEKASDSSRSTSTPPGSGARTNTPTSGIDTQDKSLPQVPKERGPGLADAAAAKATKSKLPQVDANSRLDTLQEALDQLAKTVSRLEARTSEVEQSVSADQRRREEQEAEEMEAPAPPALVVSAPTNAHNPHPLLESPDLPARRDRAVTEPHEPAESSSVKATSARRRVGRQYVQQTNSGDRVGRMSSARSVESASDEVAEIFANFRQQLQEEVSICLSNEIEQLMSKATLDSKLPEATYILQELHTQSATKAGNHGRPKAGSAPTGFEDCPERTGPGLVERLDAKPNAIDAIKPLAGASGTAGQSQVGLHSKMAHTEARGILIQYLGRIAAAEGAAANRASS